MRIAVFIDYWYLQLTLNQRLSESTGIDDYRAKINWRDIGPLFTKAACVKLGIAPTAGTFEGSNIYTSFNPATAEGKKFKNWATTWLDRQPGINVQIRERRPRALPKCPVCHKPITHCPHKGCERPIVATVEKGIDTLLCYRPNTAGNRKLI
jgi:hypothetical protein